MVHEANHQYRKSDDYDVSDQSCLNTVLVCVPCSDFMWSIDTMNMIDETEAYLPRVLSSESNLESSPCCTILMAAKFTIVILKTLK